MTDKDKLESAEFIVRSSTSSCLVMGSMPISSCGCSGNNDQIVFNASMQNCDHSKSRDLRVTIPAELPDGIDIERTASKKGHIEYRLKDKDGKKSRGYFSVIESNDPTGKFLSQNGQYHTPNGDTVDFVLWTDPEPFTVAVVGAIACVVIIGIDALTTSCNEELSDSIKACVARGGIPVFHTEVTFVIDPFDFEIGCSYHCEFDRCDFPVQSTSTTTTSTTTTTNGGVTTTTTTTTTETPITTDRTEEEIGISAAPYRRRLLSDRELRRAGVDAHAEKDAVDARPNSRFDLYIDTNNDVWVIRKTEAPRGGENIGPRRGLTYQ